MLQSLLGRGERGNLLAAAKKKTPAKKPPEVEPFELTIKVKIVPVNKRREVRYFAEVEYNGETFAAGERERPMFTQYVTISPAAWFFGMIYKNIEKCMSQLRQDLTAECHLESLIDRNAKI